MICVFVCMLLCKHSFVHSWLDQDPFWLDRFHTFSSTWLCGSPGSSRSRSTSFRAGQQCFSHQSRYLVLCSPIYSCLSFALLRRVEPCILSQYVLTFQNGGLKGIVIGLVLGAFVLGQVFNTTLSNGLEGCLILLPF